MKSLEKLIGERKDIKNIRGWLVSLYDFKRILPEKDRLTITTGDALIPLLGEEIYLRLKDRKGSFS